MRTQPVTFLAGLAVGMLLTALSGARADQQAAFDRDIVMRLVRAQETQADAQKQQAQQLRELTQVVRDAGRR